MKYNTAKLNDRIREKFGTQAAFARAVGLNKSTVKRIIDDGTEWKGSKLIKAAELLDIPADQIALYFFTPEVVEAQQER